MPCKSDSGINLAQIRNFVVSLRIVNTAKGCSIKIGGIKYGVEFVGHLWRRVSVNVKLYSTILCQYVSIRLCD